MLSQETKRIHWIDIAKAITIFLVIVGHTLRGGEVQKVIYSFHIAAFFMLSGMTCKVRDAKKQIKKDFLRIMVPYYLFGIISIFLFLVLGKFAAGQLDLDVEPSFWNEIGDLLRACPKNNRLKFNMPLWFLPCLFVTKLLYYGLHKCCRGKQLPILGISLAGAALGFVYTRLVGVSLPFNVNVAVKMLFFFSLGRVFFLFISSEKRKPIHRSISLIIGGVLLSATAAVAWLSPKVNYSGDTFPSIPAFAITALLGSFGVCFLSMGIRQCHVLEYVGQNTLPILLMHKFPVLFFQTLGPLAAIIVNTDSLPGIAVSCGIALLVTILCLLVAWGIQRFVPFLLGDFRLFEKKRHQENTD